MLLNCEGFQRDEGNQSKNWIKHSVSQSECEQPFFNRPVIVAEDAGHSQKELRWFMLGRTNSDRCLFIVFTIRGKLIRIVSARDMSKKERKIYNEQIIKKSLISKMRMKKERFGQVRILQNT